jgi:uncharacterized protein (TIRG00374 family)
MFKKILIGFFFSFLLLFFTLRNIHWHEVYHYLLKANYYLVLPAILLFLCSYGVRSFLWARLLKYKKQLSPRYLFEVLMIGLMANNILPARLGELVRVYLIGQYRTVSRTFALSTIIIERGLDVLWLLFFTATVYFLPQKTNWLLHSIEALVMLFLCLIIVLIVVVKFQAHLPHLFSFLVPKTYRIWFKTQVSYYLNALLEGLKVFDGIQNSLVILGLSLASWLIWIGFLKISLLIFDIHLPLWGTILLTSIINLGVLIPSAPGYVGVYQFACVQGLMLFSVAKSKALGFSFVSHALWYLPTTVLGIYFLCKQNLSLKILLNRLK